ncbi:MAG: DMT family transporter [Acidimicrobiia bacterium]|nr:DMT family transporter [Acidimicrobiia bacterium]
MSVLLALGAALAWGTGDFLGGVAARRGGQVNAVTLGAQVTGFVSFIPIALLLGGSMTVPDLWWALGSGVSSGIAIFLLYYGFTKTHTGVVAPTAAIFTAGIPALFGLITGENLAVAQTVGIGVALVAIWLISRPGTTATSFDANVRLGVLYGLGAGIGFGMMFIGLDQLTDDSTVLAVLPLRFGGVVAMLAVSLFRRLPMVPARSVIGLIAGSGFIGSVGNLSFIASTTDGNLAIVSVVASLFPAATVGLAYVFLGERLIKTQLIGVAAALTAVVLVSSG